MSRRLAIIPARSGSKRIKNKNIKDFCGKPMIYHIIDIAKESNLFDNIHVSTNCENIKKIVERNNINVEFLRPNSLSDDFTPLMPVISFVTQEFKKLGKNYDEIWLLMACAPLIESEDLINASQIYSKQKNNIKPLMSITEFPVPIEWAFFKKENSELIPRFKGKFIERSQDLPKSYYDSGTFIIYPKKYILEKKGIGNDSDYIGYNISKSKAIDIDTYEDWELAESILKSRKL